MDFRYKPEGQRCLLMFSCDKSRKDGYAARANNEVVISAANLHSPHLDDAQAPPFTTINWRQLLHPDDAMANRMQIEVILCASQIVEQQHRHIVEEKEAFQRSAPARR